MTYQTNEKVGKRLKKQYLLYVSFFPFCPFDKQDKLLHQMIILKEQIRVIEKMQTSDKNAKTYIHFDQKESLLNNQSE